MDTHWIFGILAGILDMAAAIPYILAVHRGETHPSRATWGIFAVTSAIITASYWQSGATTTLFFPLMNTLMQTTIFLLSLRRGVGGVERLDLFCLGVTLIAMSLWWYTESAAVALVLTTFANLVGSIPTIAKSITHPETEDMTAWSLWFAAAGCNVLAIAAWTPIIALVPVQGILGDFPIILFVGLYHARRALRARIATLPLPERRNLLRNADC